MQEPARERLPDRRLVLAAVGVLSVCSLLGRALMPVLLTEAPLLLVALSPLPAHMLMVVPLSDPIPFVIVASARRALAALSGYYVGMLFGEQVIGWLERRSRRAARLIRLLVRAFTWAPYPAIVLLPNAGTPVLAGQARMPLGRYLTANLFGQVLHTSILYYVGDALSAFILPVVDYIREHVLVITAFTVSLAVLAQLFRRRRRRGTAADRAP